MYPYICSHALLLQTTNVEKLSHLMMAYSFNQVKSFIPFEIVARVANKCREIIRRLHQRRRLYDNKALELRGSVGEVSILAENLKSTILHLKCQVRRGLDWID